MFLKAGVKVNGIQPEIIMAMLITEQVFKDAGRTLTITSITDGKHSRNSLHYAGLAFDVRTWNMTVDQKHEIARKIADALGDEFDVVVEDTHIHIEFDPDLKA
jgi:hypothetical protein